MILNTFGTTDYNGKNIANIFNSLEFYYKLIASNFVLRDYRIEGSDRPEAVAYRLYGDPNLYWVLFLVNGISDPYHEWVKSSDATQQSAIQSYQYVGGVNQVDHHVDEEGRQWFNVIENPPSTGNWYSKDAFGNPGTLVYVGTMVPVSVSEHEQDLNEDRRVIKVIHPDDMRRFYDALTDAIGVFQDDDS